MKKKLLALVLVLALVVSLAVALAACDPKDKGEIDRYGMEAMEKRISDTITSAP